MFFKTIETCTIDTSDTYVNGEKTELVFEADSYKEMVEYFTVGLANYIKTHGLEVAIVEIGADEVEAALEEFGMVETMGNVKDFN